MDDPNSCNTQTVAVVNTGKSTSQLDLENFDALSNLNVLVNGSQKKIWTFLSYSKHIKIETESIKLELKQLENEKKNCSLENEKLKKFLEFLTNFEASQKSKLTLAPATIENLKEQKVSLEKNLSDQKLHLKDAEQKYNLNYNSIKILHESYNPLYKHVKQALLEHKKLLIQKDIIVKDTRDAQRNLEEIINLNRKLFHSSIINFVKCVRGWERNKFLSSKLNDMLKYKRKLCLSYQNKCLRNEEKEKTAKEGFFQIPKLPVAKETLIQKPSYETSYDLNNIKKTTGLESSTLELIKKQKLKCENRKKKYEELMKRSLMKKAQDKSFNKSIEVLKEPLPKKKCEVTKKNALQRKPSSCKLSQEKSLNKSGEIFKVPVAIPKKQSQEATSSKLTKINNSKKSESIPNKSHQILFNQNEKNISNKCKKRNVCFDDEVKNSQEKKVKLVTFLPQEKKLSSQFGKIGNFIKNNFLGTSNENSVFKKPFVNFKLGGQFNANDQIDENIDKDDEIFPSPLASPLPEDMELSDNEQINQISNCQDDIFATIFNDKLPSKEQKISGRCFGFTKQ